MAVKEKGGEIVKLQFFTAKQLAEEVFLRLNSDLSG